MGRYSRFFGRAYYDDQGDPALLTATFLAQRTTAQTSPTAPVPSPILSCEKRVCLECRSGLFLGAVRQRLHRKHRQFLQRVLGQLKSWGGYELSQIPSDTDLNFPLRVTEPSREQ